MSTEVATLPAMRGPYRGYSDEFKAEALARYKANGDSLLQTARELDIPFQTLEVWTRNEERYSEFRNQKLNDLATKFEFNLHRLTDSVSDHDLSTVTLQAKATAIGILTDKMQLLRGQPTQIIETQEVSAHHVLALLVEAMGSGPTD